jgi:hypothetical protein
MNFHHYENFEFTKIHFLPSHNLDRFLMLPFRLKEQIHTYTMIQHYNTSSNQQLLKNISHHLKKHWPSSYSNDLPLKLELPKKDMENEYASVHELPGREYA